MRHVVRGRGSTNTVFIAVLLACGSSALAQATAKTTVAPLCIVQDKGVAGQSLCASLQRDLDASNIYDSHQNGPSQWTLMVMTIDRKSDSGGSGAVYSELILRGFEYHLLTMNKCSMENSLLCADRIIRSLDETRARVESADQH